jgi:Na+/proline symporter
VTTPHLGDARPIIVAVAAAYLVALAGISIWATRRTRTASDFFVAGDGIGLFALTVASVSTTVSGFAFIGGPGLVYRTGLGALYIILSASVTNVLGAWVLAKRMRLLAAVRPMLTIGDAIGARYDSRLAQGLAGVAMLIGVIGYVATNALAMGIVVDTIFGTGLTAGIWIGMGITLAYSMAGGILAGVYADVLQGALMALASVLVFIVVLQLGPGLGGHARSILAVEPQALGPFGTMTPLAALSLFFVFSVGSLGQPAQLHKYYMLRDPLQLRWYPLLKTLGLLVMLLLYVGVGLAVKSLVARGAMPPLARPDDATPMFLLRFTPHVLAALVFSGVMAATMSITNSFLNIGAAAITHDIPTALGRPMRHALTAGRIATLLIALAAMLVATVSQTMVAFLGVFGYGLFASTLVPALAIGLNWRGATREGAIASITLGIVLTLACETAAWLKLLALPAGVSIAGMALATSIVTFFAVSWLTRSQSGGPSLAADVRAVMDA